MAQKTSSNTSKAARASMPTKKVGGFEFAVDAPRVVPTGGGRYAYVMHLNGKTSHMKVDSAEFSAAVAEFFDTAAVRQTLPVVEAAAAQFATDGWAAALAALRGEVVGEDGTEPQE